MNPKKLVLISVILTIGVVGLVRFNIVVNSNSNNNNKKAEDDTAHVLTETLSPKVKLNSSTKTILLYTSFFSSNNWELGHGGLESNPFHTYECPVNDCYITRDRQLFADSEQISVRHFDAVLFHLENMRDIGAAELNRIRHPRQQFVVFLAESPLMKTFNRYVEFRNFFNWTMTYRSDSDIVWSYGKIYKKTSTEKTADVLKVSRPKSIVWMVSHCYTFSERERYVEELKKHIDIDIFGYCTYNRHECPRFSQNCSRTIQETYKFMLSFENSMCQDYVTEKFFNALEYGLVPVVLGKANYKEIAPPNSFINALDFESPKALANYLINLNDSEYSKFLHWRKDFDVGSTDWVCDLCSKLHEPESSPGSIRDIGSWLHRRNNSDVCATPGTFPWSSNLPVWDSTFIWAIVGAVAAAQLALGAFVLVIWTKCRRRHGWT